jgi:hypothetical protein
MIRASDRACSALAVACVAWMTLILVLAPPASAQKSDADEVFAKVDPYTKGERATLEKAGYFSFGPFPWCAGVMTQDIEEALGQRVLWVETAHFKLGSTLATYKLRNDKREEKRLAVELARLRTKLGDFSPPKGKLDPWLRLHLYALRLEDLYAELQTQMRVTDDDFARQPGAPAESAEVSPYFGQPLKPTVLLTEKTSSLGRFAKRWLHRGVESTLRERLQGRSMFVGMSAEQIRNWGYEFDLALHCTLASDVAMVLLDGFKNDGFDAPHWLKQGLTHVVSRKIDGRFTLFAAGTTREFGEEDVPWEPRVYGLVANRFATSWDDMLAWKQWSDMDAQAHLVAWSRVSWLLAQPDLDLRCFWLSVTTELPQTDPVQRAKAALARQLAAFESCFGRSPQSLDASWSAFVSKNYAKK